MNASSAEILPNRENDILQERRGTAPREWAEAQDKVAEEVGLSVVLVEGYQPPALALSNNNSVCHAFQSSPEHVALCDPFCGSAHNRAMSAGARIDYKCHAGLQCFAMPIRIGARRDLAVIGGRAFVSGADYRSLVERFRGGELNELLERSPFENVVFGESPRLDLLAKRLEKTARAYEVPADATTSSVETTDVQVNTEIDELDLPPQLSNELELEIERLRGELEYRIHLDDSLQSFLERINSKDPATTYQAILTHSRELLRAERASLWVLDESGTELILRAAVGLAPEVEETGRMGIGEGISGRALETGEALVVENIEKSEFTPAPTDRKYRTKSFISYPLAIGPRKIGLLNITDKTSGETFSDVDLSLLEMIGSQIAVALERAEWQERATQFQLMSITDPLTGLLNRRYLEERLTEELNRSKRYNYSMSCLMIDIDDFKSYNDHNGHQAGDVALKITAHSLKAALRAADIACRYGGEEFCVLLPQTSVTEAGVIAERMRQKVADTEYPHGKTQPGGSVSISIGISTFARHIDTAESVIAAADRALYSAKHRGKNRIEFYVDNLTGSQSFK